MADPCPPTTQSTRRPPPPLAAFDNSPAQDSPIVQSPSVRQGNAIARFEFEAERSTDDGTKVLMVEWHGDERTRGVVGDWTVSWEGKSRVVLPASGSSSSSTKSVPNSGVVERSEDSDDQEIAQGVVHRLYFLLPPGERVPGVITLTLTARDDKSGASEYAEGSGAVSVVTTWQTNVLPAIFPQDKSTLSPLSSLGAKTGEKGILHTIWAKKRLRVLAAEIAAEEKRNAESVGLDMAVQEKEWIIHHFGLGGSTTETDTAGAKQTSRATSPAAVVGRDEKRLEVHSPPGEDIAVGAFEDFVRHAGVQGPRVLGVKASQRVSDVVTASADDDKEDGLFALPMSPRTPLSAGSK